MSILIIKFLLFLFMGIFILYTLGSLIVQAVRAFFRWLVDN